MKFLVLTFVILFNFLFYTHAQNLPPKDLPAKLPLQSESIETKTSKSLPKPSLETSEVSEEKFAAIVQYAKGKQQYDFKDLIKFNETIEIPNNSYLKVITQKRCVAVFYENTKVQTPENKISSWKIHSGAVRWICPEDKVEKINYRKSELQIQNGEFLLSGASIIPLRDSVRYDNKNLNLETVYLYRKGKWLQPKNQPDPYGLWKKQEKFPAPIESVRHKLEKPTDPYVTRVFLNLAPIGFSGLYHHEWERDLTNFEMSTHAFRLGTNFPWKNKSIFVFLEHSEAESPDSKNSYMGPPPVGNKQIRFSATTLGVGLRHSHINSSSFYYYLGFTRQETEFHIQPDALNFYDGEVIYPYNISIGGGYQKILWPKNWISLMIGADIKFTQSLSQGKTRYFTQGWPFDKDPRSTISEISSLLYLGPTFNF